MLAVARQKKGRVTDVELAAETRYPLEECRAFLKNMTETGSAGVNIGKEGIMVYLFPGFLTEEEKENALNVSSWEPSGISEDPPPLKTTEHESSDGSTTSRSLEIE